VEKLHQSGENQDIEFAFFSMNQSTPPHLKPFSHIR